MKIFKTALLALFVTVTVTACSKSGDNVDKVATIPLVKGVATTSPNNREIFSYSYDNQQRLINSSYGTANNPITYNLGGLQIVNTSQADTKKVIDISVENGRIKTALYNVFINQVNEYLPVNATFSYDSKGRLSKIQQVVTLDPAPPYPSRTMIYTFTWDDNDNLIGSSNYNQATPGNAYKVIYSGFNTENVNTLAAKNFGFDYFGTASYNGEFYPAGDGSAGPMLPFSYPGKTLPSKFAYVGSTAYNMVYHKNAQGNIDRIEQTNAADANDYYYLDIAYQ